MPKLTVEIELNDKQIEWLDGDEDILFHCCGSGGSAHDTNRNLQSQFAAAIKQSIAGCLATKAGKERV